MVTLGGVFVWLINLLYRRYPNVLLFLAERDSNSTARKRNKKLELSMARGLTNLLRKFMEFVITKSRYKK